MTLTVGHPAGLQFKLEPLKQPNSTRGDAASYGRLELWLGEELVWGRFAQSGKIEGVCWYWIELLEHLAANWQYLRFEQGYPLGASPVSPSGLRLEVEGRWSNQGADEHEEDEIVWDFCESHNLSMALSGCTVPDLWIVKEGRIAIIEAKGAIRRCPLARELNTLELLGEYVSDLLSSQSDRRSQEAVSRWRDRNNRTFAECAALITGASMDRLEELAAGDSLEDMLADPLAPSVDESRTLDLIYRCKGRIESDILRALIRELVSVPLERSSSIASLSKRLQDDKTLMEEQGLPPHSQGRKLALVLRHDWNLFPDRMARAEPEMLLERLGARVDRRSLETRQLDAVAIWGHGTRPWVVINNHEKHQENAGAERATIAHELCHLLVDREEVLPFGAAVKGYMDRTAEQRANAFAAELLCPRFALRQLYNQLAAASDVIAEATIHFAISKEMAALQLARAECDLSPRDQRTIESYVSQRAVLPWRPSQD